MTMALEGIRILDLTRLLPGPYTSLMLADLGAEVLKIEEPGFGDYFRWMMPPKVKEESSYFLCLNRNKKSMKLNLKPEKGKEIFLKLAKDYDVILESFRPGVMDRLGVGYEAIKQVNPEIIYCAITGYGQDGPYRDRAGHDINYTGIAGILDITGERGGPPVIPGVQVADLGAGGMLAGFAILAAIIARQSSGKGQFIDVSMLDGCISWSVIAAASYFADGQIPQRGKMIFSGRFACYDMYQTKDKKYISLGALERQFWQNFCKAVGREDLIEEQFAPGEGQEELRQVLTQIFASKTRDEWVEFTRDKDFCCEPILNLQEASSHPQVRHRGMIVWMDHPTEGKIGQSGIPIKFSETPGRIRSPAPGFGQHTDRILKGLGYQEDQIEDLKKSGVI